MSKEELIEKLYQMLIDKTRHDIFDHGVGFCSVCGELQKRCECEQFVPNKPCDGSLPTCIQ